MNARGLLSRILRPLGLRAAEGQPRPGPWFLPVTGGWLPAGAPDNFWQLGIDPIGGSSQSAMVEACVSAYAQTVAMCPGDHWELEENGGRERVTTSALSRILRHPNDYQSISDFLLNATRALYLEGNAYALALRNSRFEINELHLMNSTQSFARVAYNGDIFYSLQGNDVIANRAGSGAALIVPARDVLHIRMHVGRRFPVPLMGESPVTAAYYDIGVGAAISRQQTEFYMNQARPSAVLSTDLILDKDQVTALRDRWNWTLGGRRRG